MLTQKKLFLSLGNTNAGGSPHNDCNGEFVFHKKLFQILAYLRIFKNTGTSAATRIFGFYTGNSFGENYFGKIFFLLFFTFQYFRKKIEYAIPSGGKLYGFTCGTSTYNYKLWPYYAVVAWICEGLTG